MILAACTTQVSKIIVHDVPSSSRASAFAAAHKICAEVAARHELARVPVNQWGPGCAEYEPHHGGPSMVVAPAPSPDLAVITIAGEPLTDRGRRELAADTHSSLDHRFGNSHVRSFEDRWTDF
jgi:hypothetical protein